MIGGFDVSFRNLKNAWQYAKQRAENQDLSDDEIDEAEDFKFDLRELVKGIFNYTDSIVVMNNNELNRMDMIARGDGNQIMEAEKARKMSHDALITKLRMAEASCKRNGLPPLFGLPDEYLVPGGTDKLMGEENRKIPGVVEMREAIRFWALDLSLGFTIGIMTGRDIDGYSFEHTSLPERREISEYYSKGAVKSSTSSLSVNEKRFMDELDR